MRRCIWLDRNTEPKSCSRPEQHKALVEIAQRESRSVSDLVREMLWRQLEQRGQAVSPKVRRRLEALERIRQHRAAILTRRGGKPLEIDAVEMVRRLREEQDERNLSTFADCSG